MVKFTTVVNGKIVSKGMNREQFGNLMAILKKRAKKNKLEKKKAEMMKKWNGGV
jgi:hypothetical protein